LGIPGRENGYGFANAPTETDRSSRMGLQTETPHSFLALDGIRGAAALVIVFWHAEPLFGFHPQSGYLAVDLFFALSGFVLAHAYDRKFESGMGAAEFMRVRLIRLYPLYFLAFVVMMGAILGSLALGQHLKWTPEMLTVSGLLSLGFLPTPDGMGANDWIYPLNGPAWSLAYEIFINLVFVLTWRFLSTRVLVCTLVAAGVALIGTAAAYGSLDVGSKWITVYGALPRVFFSFPLGVLLLRLHRRRPIQAPAGSILPILTVLAMLVVAPPAALRPVYDVACVVAVFPLVILFAARSHPRKLAPAYGFLGLISYAVYVLHVPILTITQRLLARVAHGNLEAGWPWVGIGFVVTAVGAAYLADVAYDRPARKWLTGKTRPRTLMAANLG
jgi:peptidoglycan/LPS O-acetylase OafA/YrhL